MCGEKLPHSASRSRRTSRVNKSSWTRRGERRIIAPLYITQAPHPKQVYEARATFLLHVEPGVPLWVGEFGACQTLECGAEADWFRQFVRLLRENPQISWSYWPLNGTQSSGVGRKYDTVESFGLLSTDYKHIAAPKIVELLRTIEK
jgi:hypothetical protein